MRLAKDLGSGGDAGAACGLDHCLREERVDVRPGGADGRREFRAEAFVQRPDQGRADRSVVFLDDAVAQVARAEGTNGFEQHVRVIEGRHRGGEKRHQFPTLLVDVASEQSSQRRIEFEQPGIEERDGLTGDGKDLAKRALNEGDIGWGHWRTD